MIQIVTWLWQSPNNLFTAEHVNRLYAGLTRHCHTPFTLWCITDWSEPSHFTPGVRTFPMFEDHKDMSVLLPVGPRACFHRLALYDRAMGNVFGPRIVQMDLDVVVTGDVTPLLSMRTEPLLVHLQRKDSAARRTYNPSLMIMDAGVLHDCWAEFHANPNGVKNDALKNGWNGSDMSILNRWLDTHPPTASLGLDDGVANYWSDCRRERWRLPAEARVVLFYGRRRLGDPDVLKDSPWIAENWK